mgnify:CR=1 FL=1
MKSVIKRILGTIPVLIGVVLLIFIMLRIVPGNAAAMLLGEHVDQATIDRLTEVMGLDKPVIVQFFDYLAGAIHGDLGISYKYNRAVTDMIIEAFPYTLELALLAALFAAMGFLHAEWLDVYGSVAVGLLSGYMVLQYSDVRSAYAPAVTGRAMAVFTMALFLGVALMQWVTGVAASIAAAQGADPYVAVMLTIAAMLGVGALAFRLLPAPAH